MGRVWLEWLSILEPAEAHVESAARAEVVAGAAGADRDVHGEEGVGEVGSVAVWGGWRRQGCLVGCEW